MTNRSLNVLITGAGSGLGRGLAISLSAGGHRIFITDQFAERAAETRELIGPTSTASSHALDVTSQDDIQALLRELDGQRIDVLVNNAGLQQVARLEEFPQDRWNLLVDVMLKGACQMSRAVLPAMRRNGFGRIINIGSIHSLVASPFKSAYVAAKHGLVGFSKVLALETADVDITVNTLCPSYIQTPLVDAQIETQAQAHGISREEVINQIMLKPMPKRRFITVEEISATVEFLAADTARNITGQCIVIDGGWTIQ